MLKRNYNLLMRSLALPQFSNIKELSNLIGLTESLIYCLSKRTENYYKKKYISKKNGEKREIYIPSYTLKIVQKWILYNILNKVKPSNQAMAFRKGKEYNCKANAQFHIETRYGVAMDLKDFFTNIKSNRIYTVFSNIGYESVAATILTNLCTLDGFLPQGSSCSPALSNLVCLSLDARLSGLCEKRRIRYSRYADDMYFSCDNQDVLKKTVPIIKKIITDEGFFVNERKVHYHTPSNRKCINGITIARKSADSEPVIKASKKLKRNIRAELYYAILSGDYSKKEHVIGEIMYVNYIENDYVEKILHYIDQLADKIRLYSELVAKYNENFFFESQNEIEKVDLHQIEKEFEDEYEFYMYMEDLFEQRQRFLKKNELKDICKYDGWPTFDTTTENDFCDDEFSF